MPGGDAAARRAAAWRFLRAVLRSEADGVVGAALSGLAWQVGAVAAPLIVARAIDHGILTRDRRTLLLWTLALLGVGLLEVLAGASRHIFAIRNRARGDAGIRDAIFAHAAPAARAPRRPLVRRPPRDLRRPQPRLVRRVQRLRRHARLAAPHPRPACVDGAACARGERTDHGGAGDGAAAARAASSTPLRGTRPWRRPP